VSRIRYGYCCERGEIAYDKRGGFILSSGITEGGLMKYKGYTAIFGFDHNDNIFHGKIDGITDLVVFEAKSEEELKDAFHEAVDDYLEAVKVVRGKTSGTHNQD